LPLSAVIGGALVFAVGIIHRAILVRIRRSRLRSQNGAT
jgi:hypothetical protein